MTPTVLPLYAHPAADPAAWRAVATAGDRLTVVVQPPGDPEHAEGVATLAAAGVTVLGYVDARYATGALPDLLDDVTRWAWQPVRGVWLDHCPTSPFSLGPVALATRVARRAGLGHVVLNPGVPTDPLYRELGAPVCTFEGSWRDYRRWSGDGSRRGDLHLVHSVPVEELAAARDLMARREAGGLVTDLPGYAGVPAWLRCEVDGPVRT